MDVFAGIDLGTTHLKVVLTDGQEQVLWQKKWPVQSLQPHQGWQEQDPLAIRAIIMRALRELAAVIPPRASRCIAGFSTAMHALLLLDKNDQPLTSIITWADTRSQPQAASLRHTSQGRHIYLLTGTPIHPMSPLCKIAWMQENRPEVMEQKPRVVSLKDWIWKSLTGYYEIDHSVASATGLFDIHRRQWCTEALTLVGITESQLSRPVSVFHHLPADNHYADLNHWKVPLVWVIGGSDGYLATLGSGATKPGDMALTIGTSGAVRVLRSQPVPDEQGVLFHYAAAEGQYLSGGAINNGGNLLAWFADIFLQGQQTTAATLSYWLDQAALVAPGADGLCCIPYVYGERAPIWDASAKASFTGIHAGHTKAHFLRAILEAVAASLYQITQAIEAGGEKIERVYASGGFTESALWLDIVSRQLNKKLIVSDEADASALGAVKIAVRSLKV